MRRLLFGEAGSETPTVRYYLLVTELSGELEQYGVEVERGEERSAIPGLAASQRRVQELLARMVRGAVTPVCARDVAEDWLGEA